MSLEKEAERNLFEKTDEINKLLSSIYLLKQKTPKNSPTLIFIDEIQESPRAIQMLRYFYEEFSELYVIAAGSLLEFALREVPKWPLVIIASVIILFSILNLAQFNKLLNKK